MSLGSDDDYHLVEVDALRKAVVIIRDVSERREFISLRVLPHIAVSHYDQFGKTWYQQDFKGERSALCQGEFSLAGIFEHLFDLVRHLLLNRIQSPHSTNQINVVLSLNNLIRTEDGDVCFI